VGDLCIPLDHRGIDLRLAILTQSRQKRFATLGGLRHATGVWMDQVQSQSAEEQLLAETGLVPVSLPSPLGDLPGVSFADFSGVGHRSPPRSPPLLDGTPTSQPRRTKWSTSVSQPCRAPVRRPDGPAARPATVACYGGWCGRPVVPTAPCRGCRAG